MSRSSQARVLASFPLRRLAVALCLLFVTGSAFSLEAPSVAVEELAKTTRSWDGAVLPQYGEGQPEVTVLKITVQPNVELPWHTHPVINAGVLLRGELTVTTDGGKEWVLHPGDPIVEVTGTIHRGVNHGPEPAEIIVFYAGVESEPITEKVAR